ncbi:hypothetical protein EMGBS15_06410 [Filimonas sp.]|nr:hypothetical protein EMGBS15_06410 [Filimonas sp.]
MLDARCQMLENAVLFLNVITTFKCLMEKQRKYTLYACNNTYILPLKPYALPLSPLPPN